jgi:hypothetical protein
MCGAVAVACGNSDDETPTDDGNGSPVVTSTGGTTPAPMAVAIDEDGDGIIDGIDSNGDGIIDVRGTPIDADGDGVPEGLDTNGDGIADVPLPGFTLPAPGTGGGNAGTGGSAVVSACDGLSKVGGTVPLIDDFEHTDTASIEEVDNRLGSWFVANDGTPGADQTPVGDAVPTADAGHTGAGFATSATGYETWGALFGVSLNDNAGSGCAYDVSSFDGISFWGKANGEDQDIRVGVPIPAIIPVSRGGTCQGEGCDDTHFTVVKFSDHIWGDPSSRRI